MGGILCLLSIRYTGEYNRTKQSNSYLTMLGISRILTLLTLARNKNDIVAYSPIVESRYSAPTEESAAQLEAFADLLHQLDVTENTSKIKTKEALTPLYLMQKTVQIIQRNNLLRLENTTLEIFLSKQQVTVNFNLLSCGDDVQPTWGQLLNDLQFRTALTGHVELKASGKDTGTGTPDASSDTRRTPSRSNISSSVDSDTFEGMSAPELPRFIYAPAREVIAFDPVSSDHTYDVRPPHYRQVTIEEAVKRADERRDLNKRLHLTKKDIVRTFLKEIESDSDSGDEDQEPAGWKKWFPYSRRSDLVNGAIDRLVALNTALHHEAIRTLQELAARKRTILKEVSEKEEDQRELTSCQKIKDTPLEKRLPSRKRFADVLYKTMKSFLATNLKRKNLMLARQRTLNQEVREMTKIVRRLDLLEKKTDWGDLALQRMQYNSALRRNDTLDADITELKNMNASYTLKLIHAREELDTKIRENRAILKRRDSSLKKKNNHNTIYMMQHKKLAEVQAKLKDAQKLSDYDRFMSIIKTDEFKNKKLKQYRTELEVGQARKKLRYYQSRLNSLTMEPISQARLRERRRTEMKKRKYCQRLQTVMKNSRKRGFGYIVEPLDIARERSTYMGIQTRNEMAQFPAWQNRGKGPISSTSSLPATADSESVPKHFSVAPIGRGAFIETQERASLDMVEADIRSQLENSPSASTFLDSDEKICRMFRNSADVDKEEKKRRALYEKPSVIGNRSAANKLSENSEEGFVLNQNDFPPL